jgi:hypothetical protein
MEDDYSPTASSLLLVSGSRYIPSAELPEYSLVRGLGGSPIGVGGALSKWRLGGGGGFPLGGRGKPGPRVPSPAIARNQAARALNKYYID